MFHENLFLSATTTPIDIDVSGNSSIIGGGIFYSDNGFYENATNSYNIEKYYYNKVLYSNELDKNEIKWRKKENIKFFFALQNSVLLINSK